MREVLRALRQLSHTEFVSGADMARHLQCSRATVHNLMQAAMAHGIGVHAVRGRGYRLALPTSWLDIPALQQAFAAEGIAFDYADALPSTNAHLMQAAAAGAAVGAAHAAHRTLACTEWQSAGRGRRGRVWQTGLADALAFSYLWRFRRTAAELSGLSLAVGVALAQALRASGVADVRLKWPNDLVIGEPRPAKLGGILIELAGDLASPCAAIIGIGLNVRGGAALTASLGQAVTDVERHAGPVDRSTLLLALVKALDAALHRFEAEGFAGFHAEWDALHAYAGRAVEIHTALGEVICGNALGVDAQGALRVQTAERVQVFHSGEVSLRGAT